MKLGQIGTFQTEIIIQKNVSVWNLFGQPWLYARLSEHPLRFVLCSWCDHFVYRVVGYLHYLKIVRRLSMIARWIWMETGWCRNENPLHILRQMTPSLTRFCLYQENSHQIGGSFWWNTYLKGAFFHAINFIMFS